MFLLSRLDRVSATFSDDVEITREFLLDRGIPAGSMAALPHFSARLSIDPSFRWDVTSIVHAVIRRENEAVDYTDILGILIGAAVGTGPFNGNNEQEESAREILRFLTQIRRPTDALEPVFVRSHNVVPVIAAPRPLNSDHTSQLALGVDESAVRPTPSVPFSLMDEPQPSRWRATAALIAGVMTLAVALGWLTFHKSRATSESMAVLRTDPSAGLPPNGNREPAAVPVAPTHRPHASLTRRPSPAVAQSLNRSSAARAESPAMSRAMPVRPPRSLDKDQSFPLVNSTPPASSDVIAGSNPATMTSNPALESAAKSAPPVNTASAGTPFVRRRLPKSVMINPLPPRRLADPSGSLSASAPGVVHPVSIGMMASNLISSPAPAYPAAASQARIQGEVMVRAIVDREGNVIDAHVVSGPVLLRDVSLEAVQHWHYRPYMQGGRPIEVATTAVLDFQLP